MSDRTNEELLSELFTATMNMTSELRMDGDEARYDKARDAVAARMAQPGEVVVRGWRPMDTAPKDGQAVLVWDYYETDGKKYSDGRLRQTGKDGFSWVVARFDLNHGWHVAASVVGGSYAPLRNPVSWMPLPARPNNGGPDDQGK